MAHVVLIGTSHQYQTRGRGSAPDDVDQFQELLTSLCSKHMVKGIAEEMNQAALSEREVSETVAQVVSATLRIEHQLSDPPPNIRLQLGIFGENEIRVDAWFKDWSPGQLEAEIRKSHEIRERHWLAQLQILNSWPILFICGANHSKPFSALLRESGYEVIVPFADWEPNPSIHEPARKAAQTNDFER